MAATVHPGPSPADSADFPASKLQALEARLLELGSLMVAYSGGVDSAYLAATAHRLLGSRMIAVIADSPSLARRDFEQACAFARAQGMPLHIIATEELDRPEYARNDFNRCFHCKDELFDAMGALGPKLGFTQIAYGMNADDTRDFRPGQRAAQEHAVLAPLADVGLNKAEIRTLARTAGYSLWDRPAAPCLSSRVEYGRAVTREVLEQIEKSEDSLRTLGFREFRVRHHGDLARVEIARAELPRALELSNLRRHLRRPPSGRLSIRHHRYRRIPLGLPQRRRPRRRPPPPRSLALNLESTSDAYWISRMFLGHLRRHVPWRAGRCRCPHYPS